MGESPMTQTEFPHGGIPHGGIQCVTKIILKKQSPQNKQKLQTARRFNRKSAKYVRRSVEESTKPYKTEVRNNRNEGNRCQKPQKSKHNQQQQNRTRQRKTGMSLIGAINIKLSPIQPKQNHYHCRALQFTLGRKTFSLGLEKMRKRRLTPPLLTKEGEGLGGGCGVKRVKEQGSAPGPRRRR